MSVHADKIDVMVTVNESATMTLNGLPMSLAGVAWRGTVLLVDGPNQIVVTAVDRAGNESRLAWTVTRTDLLAIELHVGESTARVGDETRALDAPPVIVNGVTFVPLRFIGEALGSEVQWNDALKVVMLQRSARRLQLTIGSKLAIVDGQIVELLEAPRIMNGRTMVPIRFISEAFGADVQWNPETQGISIVVNAD
jgi:predicted secreted protein